ncbi:MAG: endonuclease domain-containing protein [Candidatus Scalindua sp.]|nr:endonuclease domain-containing protein [Candidatus Scalindua sp.]
MEKRRMKADKSNNYAYNHKLQPFASILRRRMTKSEACIWKYALKARKMKGYQFRRQRPVLNYIADFMCKELKLIIELDGITHQWEETSVKDEKRSKDLESSGFMVIRFTDSEVLNNMEGVIWRIEKVIEVLESSTPLIPRQRGTQRGRSGKN